MGAGTGGGACCDFQHMSSLEQAKARTTGMQAQEGKGTNGKSVPWDRKWHRIARQSDVHLIVEQACAHKTDK